MRMFQKHEIKTNRLDLEADARDLLKIFSLFNKSEIVTELTPENSIDEKQKTQYEKKLKNLKDNPDFKELQKMVAQLKKLTTNLLKITAESEKFTAQDQSTIANFNIILKNIEKFISNVEQMRQAPFLQLFLTKLKELDQACDEYIQKLELFNSTHSQLVNQLDQLIPYQQRQRISSHELQLEQVLTEMELLPHQLNAIYYLLIKLQLNITKQIPRDAKYKTYAKIQATQLLEKWRSYQHNPNSVFEKSNDALSSLEVIGIDKTIQPIDEVQQYKNFFNFTFKKVANQAGVKSMLGGKLTRALLEETSDPTEKKPPIKHVKNNEQERNYNLPFVAHQHKFDKQFVEKDIIEKTNNPNVFFQSIPIHNEQNEVQTKQPLNKSFLLNKVM